MRTRAAGRWGPTTGPACGADLRPVPLQRAVPARAPLLPSSTPCALDQRQWRTNVWPRGSWCTWVSRRVGDRDQDDPLGLWSREGGESTQERPSRFGGPRKSPLPHAFGGGCGQSTDCCLGRGKSFSGSFSLYPRYYTLAFLSVPVCVSLSTSSFLETSPVQANPLSSLALGLCHPGSAVCCRGPRALLPVRAGPPATAQYPQLHTDRPHLGENTRVRVSYMLLPLWGGTARSPRACVLS